MSRKEIYENYIVPYLEKVKSNRATEEETKLLPEILKIALKYFS